MTLGPEEILVLVRQRGIGPKRYLAVCGPSRLWLAAPKSSRNSAVFWQIGAQGKILGSWRSQL